ncbi:zinc-ribbon domain-containing protein [Saccharopolyspora taberi]|uniref:Zinc-ribbon domain-containing protein n=1 Tax=Saccharopolyspora taberi TaxID=60895 RepID=A0ABN3VPF8_9PSEU
MIIFGSRRTVRRVANLLLLCRCCNGVYATTLNKAVTKFTLFFVPLFPIYVKHALTCTWCGTTTEISRAEADRLVQQAQGQAPQQPGPMQQFPGGRLPRQ